MSALTCFAMSAAVKEMKGTVKGATKQADVDPTTKAKSLLKSDKSKTKQTKKQAKDAKKGPPLSHSKPGAFDNVMGQNSRQPLRVAARIGAGSVAQLANR